MRRQRQFLLPLAAIMAACWLVPGVAADEVFDSKIREIADKSGEAVVGLSCQSGRMGYYGTGVVISPDGLVLTNVTVVPENARNIQVWLRGGRVVKADLVASDKSTEASLLQAHDDDAFPYVELADSSGAWLGQRAYTFGNPFHVIEYDGQVAASVGVLSGIYKVTDNGDDSNQSTYDGMILETDAAVNPGSDGGPLIDGNGRLLGIISLGFQRERRLGTAIPLHLIRERIEGLQKVEVHPTVPSGEGEPIGSTLAAAAGRISPAVVALEIDRVAEEPWKPEQAARSGLEQQQHLLRQMMDRPVGLATGVSILGGEYILTSAFHVSHQKEAEAEEGDEPLIKKILVHVEGLDEPLEAEVVGRNDPLDLALLKVAGKVPASVEIEHPAVGWGHFVAALGRQRGSDTITITTGIISTPGRNHQLVKVHQTDALADYANLGGPVIDLKGRVIGIVTFVQPESGMGLNSGVGVFTGGQVIREVIDGLKAGEHVKSPPLPFLGVGAWQGGDPAHGARVATVYKASAAYKAGVLPGDTILSIDGNPVAEWPDLVRAITSKQIGQEIEFEVERDEERLTLKAKLGRRP